MFKNLTKLHKLHLNNNLISYIHHGTFSGSDNLFEICMYNNRLITVYSFSGLKTLSSLTLFSNRISSSTFCTNFQSSKNENITKSNIDIDKKCKFDVNLNVDDLNLKDNNMKTLTKNKFRNFKALRKIDLSMNKLTQIEDGTFAVNTNLGYLVLSNNLITEFSTDSFPGTLIRLDLNGNRLKYLKADMFQKLKNLWFLFLQDNQITTIEEKTFKLNMQLRTLQLTGNNITSCLWLNHLNIKSLEDLEFKAPQISNDSCSHLFICTEAQEQSVFEVVKFKQPLLDYDWFGSVRQFKNLSCEFCECQKKEITDRGINSLKY